MNKYPWIVFLRYKSNNELLCGGSLVASSFVLSAAHCFTTESLQPEDISAVLGEHDKTSNTESILPLFSINVVKIINHENHNLNTYENDIALLKLSLDVYLTIYNPVCLPHPGATFGGQFGSAYGKKIFKKFLSFSK